MPWPGPSEYQRIIQNPRVCFCDPELKVGTVGLTPLGLPRVASGNFACVYEIRSGAQRIAVKCFIRQISDLQQRYGLISQHLHGFWLPQLVRFEYQEQGILVQKQPYPIVKMNWVDGEQLHIFVEKHLSDPHLLLDLARQWRGLAAGLHGAHMAHGDLQHGNVLVAAGELRLVDYDGMFVPALRGEQCPELGHPNYQHPKRTASDYDEAIDNFSALVVYLSLRALAAEPGLWRSFHNGDNLILCKTDFESPCQTPIWPQLRQSPDKGVQQLTEILEQCCVKSPDQVPDLETVLQGVPAPPIPKKRVQPISQAGQPSPQVSPQPVSSSPARVPTRTPTTTRVPSRSPATTVSPPISGPRRAPGQAKRIAKRALTVILVILIIAFIVHFLRLSIIDVLNFDILNWRSSAPTTSPSRFITSPAPPSPPPGALPGKIAFVSNREGRYVRPDLYIMDADGSSARQLTFVNHLDWVSNTLGIDIELDNYERDYIEYLLTAPNVVWGEVPFITQPAWSPDGQKIAFVANFAGRSTAFIYIMNADGTNLRRIPACERTPAEKWYDAECRDPSWSPDGKRIAFVKRTARAYPNYDFPWAIHVVNVDGFGKYRLTDSTDETGVHASKPVWSPDGSKIVFLRSVDDPYIFENEREIYEINADGSNERRLAQCNYCLTLAWSPDGTRIAFGSSDRNGKWGIYVMNADGSNLLSLTERWIDQRPQWLPRQALVDGLTWSPDGKWISFTLGIHHVSINRTIESWREHPGRRVIWVISADGTQLYSITYSHHSDWGENLWTGPWDYDPAWSRVLP